MENRGKELVDGAPAPPVLGHHASGNPLAGLEDPPSWVEDDRTLGSGDHADDSSGRLDQRSKGVTGENDPTDGASAAPAGTLSESPTAPKERSQPTWSGLDSSPGVKLDPSAPLPDRDADPVVSDADTPAANGAARKGDQMSHGANRAQAAKPRGKGGSRVATRERTSQGLPYDASALPVSPGSNEQDARIPHASGASASASPMLDDRDGSNNDDHDETRPTDTSKAHKGARAPLHSARRRHAGGRKVETRRSAASPATPKSQDEAGENDLAEAKEARRGSRRSSQRGGMRLRSPSGPRGASENPAETRSPTGRSQDGGRTRGKAAGTPQLRSPKSPAKTRAQTSPPRGGRTGGNRASESEEEDPWPPSNVEGSKERESQQPEALEQELPDSVSPDNEVLGNPSSSLLSPNQWTGKAKVSPTRQDAKTGSASQAHSGKLRAGGSPETRRSAATPEAAVSPDAALLGSWAFLKDSCGDKQGLTGPNSRDSVPQSIDGTAPQKAAPASPPTSKSSPSLAPSPRASGDPRDASSYAPSTLAHQSSLQSQLSFSLQSPVLPHPAPPYLPMQQAPHRPLEPPRAWAGGRSAGTWMPAAEAPLPPPHGPYGPPPHLSGPYATAAPRAPPMPPPSSGPLDAEWIERARLALEATARPFPEDECPDAPGGSGRGGDDAEDQGGELSADEVGQNRPPMASGGFGIPSAYGHGPGAFPLDMYPAGVPGYPGGTIGPHPTSYRLLTKPSERAGPTGISRSGPLVGSTSGSRHVSPKRPREDRRSHDARGKSEEEGEESEGGRRNDDAMKGEESDEEEDDKDEEGAKNATKSVRSGPSTRQRLCQRPSDDAVGARATLSAYPLVGPSGPVRSLYPPEASFEPGAGRRAGSGKIGRMPLTQKMQALSYADVSGVGVGAGGDAFVGPPVVGGGKVGGIQRSLAPPHALPSLPDASVFGSGGSLSTGGVQSVGPTHPLDPPPRPLPIPQAMAGPHPPGPPLYATSEVGDHMFDISAPPGCPHPGGVSPACLATADLSSAQVRGKGIGTGGRSTPAFEGFDPSHRGMGHANGISSDLMGGFGGPSASTYHVAPLSGLQHPLGPLPPSSGGGLRSSSTPPLRSPLIGLLTPTPGCLGLLAANPLGLSSPGSARDLTALLPPGTTTPEASGLVLTSPAARLLLTPGRRLDGLLGSPDMRVCDVFPPSGALFRVAAGEDDVGDDWPAEEA